MTDSRILPGARARLVSSDGITTPEFYRFFRELQDRQTAEQQIAQIEQDIQQATTGFLPLTTEIVGGDGIDVLGSLESGSAIVSLEPLSDSGIGYPVAISRDIYGRISGTRPLEPNDIPDQFSQYLVDGVGNYLVDESGNLLSAGRLLVFVSDLNDLPAASGGVITLPDNVCYVILGSVDLAGSRLVCGRNNTISGCGIRASRLSSAGLTGSALISSAWSVELRGFTISASIGVALDATGNSNQDCYISSVIFDNCGQFGTIKNYRTATITDATTYATGELVFDGTIQSVSVFHSSFAGLGGNNVIRIPSTCTIQNKIGVVHCFVSVPSAGEGFNVSASATIPAESYVLDYVYFSGAGTYLSGVNDTSNVSLFNDCVGIENTSANGTAYMDNNATATTITNTTDFFKVAGTTTAGGDNHKFSHSNNRLTCDAVIRRKYLITCTLSFSSGNNDVVQFGFYDSTTGGVPAISHSKSTANSSGRAENLTVQYVTNLKQNDYIEVHVKNTSSATNVTVDEMNLIIVEIS